MDEHLLEQYLVNQRVKDQSRGTWLLGSAITKAVVKGVQGTQSLSRVADQALISKPRDQVIQELGAVLQSSAREMLDPERFSATQATFCALLGLVILNMPSQPCVVFVTIRSLSDNSTQVLFEGYAKGWGEAGVRGEINRLRKNIAKKLGW